ncbi:MAG TPA: hypothetical protein VFN91_16885, partial [Myxococcaceae bacterium]|nr:hypothetical protein [Myxococcaceae bacterium]
WQTPFLPLLYVAAAMVAGLGFVIFVLLMASLRHGRPIDLGVLGELGNLLSIACFAFLAIRVGDLVWRHQLGAAFAFDRIGALFLLELGLILVPAVSLRVRAVRETPRTLLNMSVLACLGGLWYRFVPTTIAYHPAPLSSYFPALPELLMTLGYISLAIVGFQLAVKYFAVLPASPSEWRAAVGR